MSKKNKNKKKNEIFSSSPFESSIPATARPQNPPPTVVSIQPINDGLETLTELEVVKMNPEDEPEMNAVESGLNMDVTNKTNDSPNVDIDNNSGIPLKEAQISQIRKWRQANNQLSIKAQEQEKVQAEIKREKINLEDAVSRLKSHEAALADREKVSENLKLELITRETTAKAGFPHLLREARESLEKQYRELELQVEADRVKFQDINNELRNIKNEREKFKFEQELATEEATLLGSRAEKLAEIKYSGLKDDLDSKESTIKQLETKNTHKQERIELLEKQIASLGGKSIPDVLAEQERLREQVERLEIEAVNNPGQKTAAELKKKADRVDGLDAEILRLGQVLSQTTAERDRIRIPVIELESHNAKLRALQLQNETLKAYNEILEKDVVSKLNQATSKNPFPEMGRMDLDPKLQDKSDSLANKFDLKILVTNVQSLMAARDKPLYYDLEHIRCFLAGMAMSKLHILQGISGTGKTSLPRAFADALGGHSDKIAIQAGWKDRQDLLGFYNAFDKKYHETEFVKSLYRAQCPYYEDKLCIIILDEMNLSYIEQYGADLLSELESPNQNGMQLTLMDSKPPNHPNLLRDGMAIPVPNNVWFVGTANRDETTKDFADKSYDRAHTMELPRHPQQIPSGNKSSLGSISMRSLINLFELAEKNHKQKAVKASEFINGLDTILKDKFDIGWGNRLEKQVSQFIPVYIDAGGGLNEAVDHIVATKLLRKLENKHNVRPKDLRDLADNLKKRAGQLLGGELKTCEKLLESLIRNRSFEENG